MEEEEFLFKTQRVNSKGAGLQMQAIFLSIVVLCDTGQIT